MVVHTDDGHLQVIMKQLGCTDAPPKVTRFCAICFESKLENSIVTNCTSWWRSLLHNSQDFTQGQAKMKTTREKKVLYCREEGERGSSAALSSNAALLRPNGAIHNIYVIVKVIVNISLLRKADSRKEYGRLGERECAE